MINPWYSLLRPPATSLPWHSPVGHQSPGQKYLTWTPGQVYTSVAFDTFHFSIYLIAICYVLGPHATSANNTYQVGSCLWPKSKPYPIAFVMQILYIGAQQLHRISTNSETFAQWMFCVQQLCTLSCFYHAANSHTEVIPTQLPMSCVYTHLGHLFILIGPRSDHCLYPCQ